MRASMQKSPATVGSPAQSLGMDRNCSAASFLNLPL